MRQIIALHAIKQDKLETVKTEMLRLGAPTIRCVEDGNGLWAVEGTHRLAAAAALGLTPVVEILDGDDETEIQHLDLDGLDDQTMTLAEVRAYVVDTSDQSRVIYRIE
jgi:hypothetical protein